MRIYTSTLHLDEDNYYYYYYIILDICEYYIVKRVNAVIAHKNRNLMLHLCFIVRVKQYNIIHYAVDSFGVVRIRFARRNVSPRKGEKKSRGRTKNRDECDKRN